MEMHSRLARLRPDRVQRMRDIVEQSNQKLLRVITRAEAAYSRDEPLSESVIESRRLLVEGEEILASYDDYLNKVES